MPLHYRHTLVNSLTKINAVNNLNKKTQKFWSRWEAHVFLILILELHRITRVFKMTITDAV